MGPQALAPMVDKVNMLEETSRKRSSPGRRNQEKVPKRIHKAEREKMKREILNELFLGLANLLDLNEQNNGKASVLCEAARLLNNLLGQMSPLRRRMHLCCLNLIIAFIGQVTMEKNEVKEENSALETQIEKLQGEIEARVAQSKPDLNVHPHLELQPLEQAASFPGESLHLSTTEATSQQGPAVLIVPLHHHLQAALSVPGVAEMTPKPTSITSKPHARYPTARDSWPSELLGEQPTSR